jgi:gamma-glutamyltranspeptidase/glutathione hydrolase
MAQEKRRNAMNDPQPSSASSRAHGRPSLRAAVAAPQPPAVEAGVAVLRAGGNAVDAAVTCALVQGVVSPQMCGIGGYAVVTLQRPGEGARYLDAPATAGSGTSPEMWRDRLLRPNPAGWGYFLEGRVNDIGYSSICTPGTVRMLSTLLTRYGTRTWREAVEPARRLAAEGFVVSQHLASGWKRRPAFPEATSLQMRIESNAEAQRVYLDDAGAPFDEGDTLRNPDLAATLAHLGDAGADDFYTGEMAERIGADLAAGGSHVTGADLAEYRLREPEPVRGRYRGFDIATASAPHGGPTLVAALNILERYDLAALEHNGPEYIYLVAMAMKAAFADRNLHLGDPTFVEVPLAWMTSEERADRWQQHIDRGDPILVAFEPPGSPDTTQVSVVDADGTWISLTHSLGSSSGVITPGLGFMYNNSMTNFHPLPGHPNAIAPGKGRSSGMTPTVLSKGGEPFMAIGAPGATRIITGVLQTILNVVDFGMDPQAAVAAPRFDCQGDLISCHARIPEAVCAEVRRRHPIVRTPRSYGDFGLVHAVVRDPETGRLSGGADPGAGGMALGLI